MNSFRLAFFQNLRCLRSCLNNSFVSNHNNLRSYCEYIRKVPTEKSVNRVTLLGRVGQNPQLRGTEANPVVLFSLATNITYRNESGDLHQKTEWHRISIFRPHLREVVLQHLQKGTRIYLEGYLSHGEITDANGVVHNITSVVGSEIIFVSSKKEAIYEDAEEDSSAL